MIKALAVTLAGSLLGSGFVGEVIADEKARDALASHTLKALDDGAETKLSALRGEIVVVNFWASWCAPCLKELPIMDGWNTAWAGRGARVVAISIDKSKKKAKRFVEKANLELTVLHDGPSGLAKTLDLPSLPCTFLLDRKGNIVTVVRSSSMKDLDALQQKVEFLLTSTAKPRVQKAGMEQTPADATASTDGGDER